MKSVVVCASKKNRKEVRQFCEELEKLGVVVQAPDIQNAVNEDEFFHSEKITKIVFTGLTLQHFDWIRKADVVYVYNGNDYVGTSVTLEIGYACALGKPIYAFSEKTGDPCRDALIDRVVKTPSELAKMLK